MIELITHGINLLRCKFRDVGISTKRSGRWPTVEKHFREEHPTCAACGGTKNINIHHIHPFHVFPALELDPNNLITLCMGKLECHLQLGHFGNFKFYNPNIRKDAATVLAYPDKFDDIVKESMANRKVN
jgi:5-methylcytosine-specific restriction protein A